VSTDGFLLDIGWIAICDHDSDWYKNVTFTKIYWNAGFAVRECSFNMTRGGGGVKILRGVALNKFSTARGGGFQIFDVT
jgi:hypothetical protein